MIDRKRYLELCRDNSVKADSVIVHNNGIKYSPLGLNIWFNDKGETKNTAVLEDIKSNCVVYADIAEVSELTN